MCSSLQLRLQTKTTLLVTMAKEEETFNRLFILGGKGCSEEDVRSTFEQYGTVKNVWIVKDRVTGADKGE